MSFSDGALSCSLKPWKNHRTPGIKCPANAIKNWQVNTAAYLAAKRLALSLGGLVATKSRANRELLPRAHEASVSNYKDYCVQRLFLVSPESERSFERIDCDLLN